MQNNLALKIEKITKDYQLYDRNLDRIKDALNPFRKKLYHPFRALSDVSFEVYKGEFFGIIGKNGGGKSTLLQIICGIIRPNNGMVHVNGRVAALLELGAGFNPEFTGRENITVNAAILGLNQKQIQNRMDEIISFADIGEFLDQKVKYYSSGMFMRLAFSVSTSVDADILLIDEALGVGDFFFRQKCYQRLNELKERGVSIILVTHAMTEIQQFCQRALLLNKGNALFCGPSTEAVEKYYLLNQTRGNYIIETTEQNSIRSEFKEFMDNSSWPNDNIFVDASSLKQVSNGSAKCTKIALCDYSLNPSNSFQQGDTAVFLYEFQLNKHIDVPIGGIVIQNDKGLIIHGKNTLQYDCKTPSFIPKGSKIRFKQEVKMDIACGEYVIEVGFAAISKEDYESRGFMLNDELDTKYERLCHLPVALQFAILPREQLNPVQVLHHGIVDLPGKCNIYIS